MKNSNVVRSERELPEPHLRDKFEGGMISILAVMTLWERGSHIGHTVCYCIIMLKNVESLIGTRHENIGFFK